VLAFLRDGSILGGGPASGVESGLGELGATASVVARASGLPGCRICTSGPAISVPGRHARHVAGGHLEAGRPSGPWWRGAAVGCSHVFSWFIGRFLLLSVGGARPPWRIPAASVVRVASWLAGACKMAGRNLLEVLAVVLLASWRLASVVLPWRSAQGSGGAPRRHRG
jgi:hypothetical protein